MTLINHLNHLGGRTVIGFTISGAILVEPELRSPVPDNIDEIVSYTDDFNPSDETVLKIGDRYFIVTDRDANNERIQLEVAGLVKPMAKVVRIDVALGGAKQLYINQPLADAMDGKTLRVDDNDSLLMDYPLGTVIQVTDSAGANRFFAVTEELNEPVGAAGYGYLTLEAF